VRTESIERELHDFLVGAIPAAARLATLGPEDRLFELSLFDSAAMIETISFCEERFAIEFPECELIPDNFETIRQIALVVDRAISAQSRKGRWWRRARELGRWRSTS
jgi:acyl carrier protein